MANSKSPIKEKFKNKTEYMLYSETISSVLFYLKEKLEIS
jgi:hypothetical protein